MKYCRNCGQELRDDSQFCDRCGHPQKPMEVHAKAESGSKGKTAAIIIILIALAIGVFAYITYKDAHPEINRTEYSSENIGPGIDYLCEEVYADVTAVCPRFVNVRHDKPYAVIAECQLQNGEKAWIYITVYDYATKFGDRYFQDMDVSDGWDDTYRYLDEPVRLTGDLRLAGDVADELENTDAHWVINTLTDDEYWG